MIENLKLISLSLLLLWTGISHIHEKKPNYITTRLTTATATGMYQHNITKNNVLNKKWCWDGYWYTVSRQFKKERTALSSREPTHSPKKTCSHVNPEAGVSVLRTTAIFAAHTVLRSHIDVFSFTACSLGIEPLGLDAGKTETCFVDLEGAAAAEEGAERFCGPSDASDSPECSKWTDSGSDSGRLPCFPSDSEPDPSEIVIDDAVTLGRPWVPRALLLPLVPRPRPPLIGACSWPRDTTPSTEAKHCKCSCYHMVDIVCVI